MARGKKMTQKELVAKLATDTKTRKATFKDLLSHILKGYSLDCFGPLSEESIRTYIKAYPEDFVWEDLEIAMRQAKEGWEDIGRRQADGHCIGNSRSWYYNMVNRYGWHEKAQIDTKHDGQVTVNVISYASTKALQSSVKDVTT